VGTLVPAEAERGPRRHEVRSFATTTAGLLALADWLAAHGCTHVAMEATGVYWKPVWHVLEADFALVLANAQHIRTVPGRKTDVSDAAWIAGLLAHGLIRGSFVPPARIQALRDLTRTRKQQPSSECPLDLERRDDVRPQPLTIQRNQRVAGHHRILRESPADADRRVDGVAALNLEEERIGDRFGRGAELVAA